MKTKKTENQEKKKRQKKKTDDTKIDLVEKHDFKKGSKMFEELDKLCFLSKNLYNATLYQIRQHFFKTGKYLSYSELNKIFALEDNPDYRALPAKVSQQTMRLVEQNFKSFFALNEKKKRGEYNEKVHIPKYLHKTNGRQVVQYTKQAISVKRKQGFVNLSGTDIFIKTEVDDIQFVRIVSRKYKITVEIGYRKDLPKIEENRERKFASIDIGVDNLATVTFTNEKPFIINGKPLKSINQNYNKQNAKWISRRESHDPDDKRRTKRMNKLSDKRTNRINDYLHKASRLIVNQLVSRKITDLVIGKNKNWKQDTKLGKASNQNFVQIPFARFIEMLSYKCKLVGIRVHLVDESYSSKASFLNRDFVPDYKKKKKKDDESQTDKEIKNKKKEKVYTFSGYRENRGTYKIKGSSRRINADVNGSLNIMRKFFYKNKISCEFNDEICTLSPRIFNIEKKLGNHTFQKKENWKKLVEKDKNRPFLRYCKEIGIDFKKLNVA